MINIIQKSISALAARFHVNHLVSLSRFSFMEDVKMKLTKSNKIRAYIIGESTIWYCGNEMVLKAIEPQDQMSHSYTSAPFNCYTYGTRDDGTEYGEPVAYYWVCNIAYDSSGKRIKAEDK